jgi:26S proteasome regulatory subunit N10
MYIILSSPKLVGRHFCPARVVSTSLRLYYLSFCRYMSQRTFSPFFEFQNSKFLKSVRISREFIIYLVLQHIFSNIKTKKKIILVKHIGIHKKKKKKKQIWFYRVRCYGTSRAFRGNKFKRAYSYTHHSLDNSEWMRNGDYTPDRLQAQHDSATLIVRRRLQMNPESTVGVLTMAGRGPDLKVTPSRDNQKLLSSMQDMRPNGKIKLINSIKISMLALKHRQNKRGESRIVVFVGSPIDEKEKDLKKLGKLLKRDTIGLDLILMGCDKANKDFENNESLAKTLVDAANKENNSYITVVAPGVLPSTLIGSSHLCVQGAGAPGTQTTNTSGGSGGNDAFAEFGGIDPSVDPEMAMVMRMSLMEARQQQQGGEEKVEDKNEDDVPSKTTEDDTATTTTTTSTVAPSTPSTTGGDSGGMTDAQLLQQALALSMAGGGDDNGVKMDEDDDDDDEEEEDEDEEDDDEDLRAALLMSQGATTTPSIPTADTTTTTTTTTKDDSSDVPSNFAFSDPDFVQNMLRGLPGVDPDDERIKAALAQISGNKDGDDKKKDSDGSKDK